MSETPLPQAQGKTTIAPEVLLTIAQLTMQEVKGVSRLSQVPSNKANRLFKRNSSSEGVYIEIVDDIVNLDLYVILQSNVNVRDVSRIIQHNVARAISEMVGMQVGQINVHIEDIDFPEAKV